LFRSRRGRRQPAIPHPDATVLSMQLVEAVQMLQGQRGSVSDCAVTWGELLALGLIKEDQIPTDVGDDRLR
jgi:hypothetical protein